ncbi:hypothetical protein MKZ38_007616 [Zalerion maritima]|uniref:Bromodomain-containing protein n=1 Tax=Zalerion maritima TaxID=339359 RepID=A0AAD5S060_9PEZI|nr:hypothetical protein MKZ38_007616 [Zalerion maritima]
MNSHQLEGAVLDQKIQAKMASDVEQKVNGVNGHPSPPSPKDIVTDEPEVSSTPPPPPPTADSKPTSDGDDSKPQDASVSDKVAEKRDDASVSKPTSPEPGDKDSAMDVDIDKPDEPTVRESKLSDDKEAAPEVPKDMPTAEEAPAEDEVMNDAETVEPTKPDEPAEHVAKEPDAAKPEKEDEPAPASDVEMKDAPETESQAPTVQGPALSAEHPEASGTQDTSMMSDADAPSQSAEKELSPQPSSVAAAAVPSILESIKSPVKNVREREDDNPDEPPAKRARTESQHPPDSVASEAAESKPAAPESAAPDLPAGEQEANTEITAVRDDWSKYAHPGREDQPLTPTMVKEAKKAIAGIKKTKVGGQLCKPIEASWPQLQEEYYARIKKPVNFGDIDGKLKEGKYATLAELKADLDLIYSNAIDFNGLGHIIAQQAHDYVERVMRALKIESHDKPRPARKDSMAKPPPPPKLQAPPPPKQQPVINTRAPSKPSKRGSHAAAAAAPVATSPAPAANKSDESPTFAVTPSGMPLIRRDSTKNDGKRPIHPPKNKDLDYSNKGQKKKLSIELRFYEEILKDLRSSKYSVLNKPFLSPVDPVALNIPTYFNIIKKPMDLSTLAGKLESGEYKKGKDFEADMTLMFKNCFKFNPSGNAIHDIGRQFEAAYKNLLARKDSWMKENAPPPPPPKSARPNVAEGSDSEESEGEPEPVPEVPQGDGDVKKQQETVKILDGRVREENKKLDEELRKPVPNESIIQIGQLLLTTLMQQLLQEKKKLAEMSKSGGPAPRPKPAKATKAKAGGGAQKKASAAAKKAGGGRKASKKRAEATDVQREVVTDGILQLDETNMNKCIEIIKKDTNETENDSGELELDINVLSSDAVWKLYDIIKAKLPHIIEAHAQPDATRQPTPDPEPSPPRAIAKAAKPKKNKPMNKQEQERKIEQLKELKAQFQRGGSGSQEPLPSVEDEVQDDSTDDDEPSDSEEE